MESAQGRAVATALILAGLDHDAVIRGIRVELGLSPEDAEQAWTIAAARLAV